MKPSPVYFGFIMASAKKLQTLWSRGAIPNVNSTASAFFHLGDSDSEGESSSDLDLRKHGSSFAPSPVPALPSVVVVEEPEAKDLRE